MNLLKYEFIETSPTSYNGLLSSLVKQIRHYYTNESIDVFKDKMPDLKKIEAGLQKLDSLIGNEKKEYISLILQELEYESQVGEQVLNKIKWDLNTIFDDLRIANYLIEELKFEFKQHRSLSWIEFNGTINEITQVQLNIIKDIFRYSCYKYNVLFIDKS